MEAKLVSSNVCPQMPDLLVTWPKVLSLRDLWSMAPKSLPQLRRPFVSLFFLILCDADSCGGRLRGSAGILPPPFIPHVCVLPQFHHLHKTTIKTSIHTTTQGNETLGLLVEEQSQVSNLYHLWVLHFAFLQYNG